MFNAISWNEFLITTAITVGGYYLITGLLFYRDELKSLLTAKSKKEAGNLPDNQNNKQQPNLMGAARYEHTPVSTGVNSINADDLAALPIAEQPQSITRSVTDVQVVGTVADLIHEIKTLLEVIAAQPKEESTPLLQSLLSRYPQISGTRYQSAINFFIQNQAKEQCEFDLPLSEINSWWPSLTPNENQ